MERFKDYFRVDRIKEAIHLDNSEIGNYLNQFDNEEFTIFEKPLCVDVTYLGCIIGHDIYWVISDTQSKGGFTFYLFARIKWNEGQKREFYEWEKDLEFPFMTFIGQGYRKGAVYIE